MPRGQPVPLGVAGRDVRRRRRVWRAAISIAPELTDARFIPDPFAAPASACTAPAIWRDGAPTASIEYLGRIDHQVKIRGFRIELGEIEAVIAQGPGVRESVVVVREDTPGDRRLVAYIAGNGDKEAMLESVRRKLGAALPDYMVPAHFVLLDAMPLTSNGKVDRAALPTVKGQARRGWIAPATPIENTLARLWSEVLDVDTVSRDDNFFELGGHSLLVVTLLEQMRRAGFAADVRTVFSNPVLSAMAAAITVGAGNEAPAGTASEGVPADCTRIEPGMLPLAGLTQGEIDAVCAAVPEESPTFRTFTPCSSSRKESCSTIGWRVMTARTCTRFDGSWPSTGASGSIGFWLPCR